jgi:hypothetical protein
MSWKRTLGEVARRTFRVSSIAFASVRRPHTKGHYELSGAINRYSVIAIADFIVVGLLRAFVLLFAVDEAPALIHLDIGSRDVVKRVPAFLATFAGDQKQIDDGIPAGARDAFDRANEAHDITVLSRFGGCGPGPRCPPQPDSISCGYWSQAVRV